MAGMCFVVWEEFPPTVTPPPNQNIFKQYYSRSRESPKHQRHTHLFALEYLHV